MTRQQVGWYDGSRVHQMDVRPVGEVPRHLAHTANWVPVFVGVDAQQAKDVIDAGRYRWLRAQHWSDNTLCVVARPKDSVMLGCSCPSGELLDDAIAIRSGEKVTA